MFDKDDQEFSQIIDQSLELILSGQSSLEDVLQQNPEVAGELRPELEAAVWLFSRRDEVQPRPGFLTNSRKRVVERVKLEAANGRTKRAIFGFIWPKRLALQWVAAAVVLFLVFTGSVGSVVSFSQGTMPGDDMYPVKRFSEQVAVDLAYGKARQAELRSIYSERRLYEVETLISQGDYHIVEPTIKDYELEVQQSIQLLQQIEDVEQETKRNLAFQIQEGLTKQADRLEDLKGVVPTDVRSGLVQARDVSISGAALASEVLGSINKSKNINTPTTIVTVTPTPAATKKWPATRTMEPPTATPLSVIVDPWDFEEATLEPGYGEPEPTLTSRPTNVNRPTKQIRPENSSKAGKDNKDKEEKENPSGKDK